MFSSTGLSYKSASKNLLLTLQADYFFPSSALAEKNELSWQDP